MEVIQVDFYGYLGIVIKIYGSVVNVIPKT